MTALSDIWQLLQDENNQRNECVPIADVQEVLMKHGLAHRTVATVDDAAGDPFVEPFDDICVLTAKGEAVLHPRRHCNFKNLTDAEHIARYDAKQQAHDQGIYQDHNGYHVVRWGQPSPSRKATLIRVVAHEKAA